MDRPQEFTKDIYWMAAKAIVDGHVTLDQVADDVYREFGRDKEKTKSKVQKRVDELRAQQPAAASGEADPERGILAGGQRVEEAAAARAVQEIADDREPAELIGTDALPEEIDDIDVEDATQLEGGEPPPFRSRLFVRPEGEERKNVRRLKRSEVVQSAFDTTGLSRAEWNALPQRTRDAATLDELDFLRETAQDNSYVARKRAEAAEASAAVGFESGLAAGVAAASGANEA